MNMRQIFVCAFAIAASAQVAHAVTVTSFTDKLSFSGQLAGSATVGFGGVAANRVITGQYAPWGVTFTDGDDRSHHSPALYPTDGRGLSGGASTAIAFDQSWNAFGFSTPGEVDLQFFDGSTAIGGPLNFLPSGGGSSFGGFVTDTPFDRVVISSPNGSVELDDIIFGGTNVATVPVPMSAMLLGTAVAGLGFAGRRRRTAAS